MSGSNDQKVESSWWNRPFSQALQIVLLGAGLLIAIGVWVITSAAGIGLAVCLAGAVGGVANNFRRLERLDQKEWEKLDATARGLMTLQIYVSPLIGALFAFVLYIAFASEILKGELFPEFTLREYGGLKDFIDHAVPTNSTGAARALFWSFVAGFAEGFVPNFIDKVAKTPAAGGAGGAGGAGDGDS